METRIKGFGSSLGGILLGAAVLLFAITHYLHERAADAHQLAQDTKDGLYPAKVRLK